MMEQYMLDNMNAEKKKARECSSGMMEALTKVSLETTLLKEKVSTNGQMDDSTRETGKEIR